MARINAPLPAERLAHLNDPDPEVFKNPKQLEYVRTLVNALRDVDRASVSKDMAANQLILMSPNGTAFRVTVKDDGTLNVANARG